MVDAVAVSDKSVGDAAKVEQAIPVGIVARRARDFEAEHDAHVAKRHFRGHACEPGTLGESGAGHTQVFVDDDHCSLTQPSSSALSTNAYWRAVDSRLYST